MEVLPQRLADLIKNRDSLTDLQLYQLVQELKKIAAEKGLVNVITTGPAEWAAEHSGGQYRLGAHHKLISEAINDLEHHRGLPRLMVNLPPRHSKSETISFWTPIWALAKNPRRKIILVSYEFEFATHWGRRVRDWIIANGGDLGLYIDKGSTAAHNWSLKTGGGMVCAGAGGPITGKGGDILILDDPIKNWEEANSETMRENLWSWYQTVFMTRLQPGGYIVVLGTMWHEDDLLCRIEKGSQPNENGETSSYPYQILKLPALAEQDDILGRAPGEPLWPEMFPLEKLQEIRKGMSPYHWSALYQQHPTPEEGNAVKRSWWKFYETMPECDFHIQSWDLAFTDMKKGSYTVGQIWGRKGAQLFLLDQIRDHMNAKDVIKAIRNWQQKWPKAVGKLIEHKASGPAIIQMFQHEVQGMIPVKVANESKDARLQSVIPLIEAGNVILPTPGNAPWVQDYIEEFATFPRGTYDDQVDCTTQALRYLTPQAWSAVNKAHDEASAMAAGPINPISVQQQEVHQFIKKTLRDADRKFKTRGMHAPGRRMW